MYIVSIIVYLNNKKDIWCMKDCSRLYCDFVLCVKVECMFYVVEAFLLMAELGCSIILYIWSDFIEKY